MRIALAGFGLEGKASYDYWNTPDNEVVIADERETVEGLPEGVPTILGPGAFSKLADFDMVIRTPSVRPDKLVTNGKIWSTTNEFFATCPAPIIGVTGTKGKGTTSSLIASILRTAGKTVHLVGNIGTPALTELPKVQPNDIVVFELSSFQLWDVEKSPHVAVVLGIEPDHLDVHASMDEYVEAKRNIARFQGEDDIVVFNQNNEFSTKIASYSQAQHVPYPFDISDVKSALQIPGEHNVENASAAVAAVKEYVTDPEILRRGLGAFTGLPHRIKFIREVDGVKYYDDSYSSAPSASIAALSSFQQPEVILLGGYEKGASFADLAEKVKTLTNFKKAVLYGQTKNRIVEAFEAAGVARDKYEVLESTDFTEIVHAAAKSATTGDVVLLSPACASFDMFKNFTERGNQFIEIVEKL